MTDIYVIAKMIPGEMQQRRYILDALRDGDWYTSEIGALATMDQLNHYLIEELTEQMYRQAVFLVYGVFKMSLEGLVGTYDN